MLAKLSLTGIATLKELIELKESGHLDYVNKISWIMGIINQEDKDSARYKVATG